VLNGRRITITIDHLIERQILIGGMAADLRQARAKTLMWSLDGALDKRTISYR
jgi:hypothetical protein